MGRKIPAKKHRGVKDPLEQQARRLQSLKCKINAPPSDPEEQPVPRSLTRLFAVPHRRSRPDTPRLTKHHDKQTRERDGRAAGDNPVSRLRPVPGESGREFSLRINSAVRALAGDARDYPQDLEEESDSRGARMSDLRSRRLRKQRRAAARLPPAETLAPAQRNTRTHKLALKKKAKKDKADEAAVERREVQYERVPFGEVTHAPPAALPAPRLPRGAARTVLTQAGRRGLLRPGGAGAGAREEAILAYRALKAERARKPAPAPA